MPFGDILEAKIILSNLKKLGLPREAKNWAKLCKVSNLALEAGTVVSAGVKAVSEADAMQAIQRIQRHPKELQRPVRKLGQIRWWTISRILSD